MKYIARLQLAIIAVYISCIPGYAIESYELQRKQMIAEIIQDVVETSHYLGIKTLDRKVLHVMSSVPRHEFVPKNNKSNAYLNHALPIGHGQTISQPYIVAIMTQLLNLDSTSVVLEIGTGSGYQAAVLAELAANVYSIEIIEPLAKQAIIRLDRLGYKNVKIKHADGYYGWAQHAPYDAIMVTAAASHVPPSLIKQLKPGGQIIIPVGSRFMTQQLLLINKQENNKLTTRQILPVRFVPFTGDH